VISLGTAQMHAVFSGQIITDLKGEAYKGRSHGHVCKHLPTQGWPVMDPWEWKMQGKVMRSRSQADDGS
jgi:hypothetical protein